MSPIAAPPPKHRCTFAGCHFAFAKRNHLERHRKTHTQSQEYACPTCKRRFSRLDSRNRHIQRVHSSTPRRQSSKTQNAASVVSQLDNDDDQEDSRRDIVQDESASDSRDFHAETIDYDGHANDDAAYYGAAEQLSRLRHQPLVSGPSTQNFFEDDTMNSNADVAATSPLFTNINAVSPSSVSMENGDSFLDFDPMMCSLLWKTLEASITEASGPSYLRPSSRTSGDHSGIFDLLTWQTDSPISSTLPALAHDQDSVQIIPPAGVDTNLKRHLTAPSGGRHSRGTTIAPAEQHQYDAASTMALGGPGPTQMAAQMKTDLHTMMGHIEAPIEPEKGLASSCFWLCRRHFLPASVLSAPRRMSSVQDDRYALFMNLIAVGSLWHHNHIVKKWGADIWSFTLRVVWSRGMRNVQDDVTVTMLMSILLSGHSYVLMSSDPAVHRLGRRAWLFCHLLHDNCHLTSTKSSTTARYVIPGIDDDLEFHLNQDKYRAELRSNADLLHHTWQKWKELEEGIRVAWGICLYDSQQAAWLDMKPSLQADVSRRYPEPASEKLLEAKTAQEWLTLYEADTPKRRDLISIMKLLHRPFPCSSEGIEWSSSQQAQFNIIESIYSSWLLDKATLGKTSEYWNMAAQRLPQDLGLLRSAHALANWRLFHGAALKKKKEDDTFCLLIRWHCVHLNFACNDVDLVQYIREQTRHLCKQDEAVEALQIPSKHSRSSAQDFYRSARGRRSLWHAGRIVAELSKLPRVASTPLHVAQAAYESSLLLVAFALIAKQRQDTRQGKGFEVLGQHDDDSDDQWAQIGLAGFLTPDGETNETHTMDDSANTDWANLHGSAACRWIVHGQTQDTIISGLSIHQCGMALQDVKRALEQSRLLWCLAADYQTLIDRGLSLL